MVRMAGVMLLGSNGVLLPVVNGDQVRRRDFVPVERGIAARDHRPCVSVSGCFASEESRIEFLEGGVEIVRVDDNRLRSDCRC